MEREGEDKTQLQDWVVEKYERYREKGRDIVQYTYSAIGQGGAGRFGVTNIQHVAHQGHPFIHSLKGKRESLFNSFLCIS